MGRRILAILAAAVIALIGAVLVLLYARGADDRAVAAASPTHGVRVERVVPAGTTLKEAVRLEQISQTQVARARRSRPGPSPRSTTRTVPWSRSPTSRPASTCWRRPSVRPRSGRRRCRSGPGKLAVSVQLERPRSRRHVRDPGSHLTLFMTYQLKRLDATEEAKVFNEQDVKGTSVLLDNIKVIAMGDAR